MNVSTHCSSRRSATHRSSGWCSRYQCNAIPPLCHHHNTQYNRSGEGGKQPPLTCQCRSQGSAQLKTNQCRLLIAPASAVSCQLSLRLTRVAYSCPPHRTDRSSCTYIFIIGAKTHRHTGRHKSSRKRTYARQKVEGRVRRSNPANRN